MSESEPIFNCPHCQTPILIEKLNCGIFRHAVFKKTGKQIGPHSTKEKCERLSQSDLIWGCGKPFQIITTSENKLEIKVCDYI